MKQGYLYEIKADLENYTRPYVSLKPLTVGGKYNVAGIGDLRVIKLIDICPCQLPHHHRQHHYRLPTTRTIRAAPSLTIM